MHLAPHDDAVLAAAGVVLPVDVVVRQHAVNGRLRPLPAVLAKRPEQQQVGFGFDRIRHLGKNLVPHKSCEVISSMPKLWRCQENFTPAFYNFLPG